MAEVTQQKTSLISFEIKCSRTLKIPIMRSDSTRDSATRSPVTRSFAMALPTKRMRQKDHFDQPVSALVDQARNSYQMKYPRNTGNPSYVSRSGVVYINHMTLNEHMTIPGQLDKVMRAGGLSCPATMANVAALLDPLVYLWDIPPVDEQGKLTKAYKHAPLRMQGLMLVLHAMKVETDAAILCDQPEGVRQAASLADGLLTLMESHAGQFNPDLKATLAYTGEHAMPLHLLYCIKGLSLTASIYARCIEQGVGSGVSMNDRFERWSHLSRVLRYALSSIMGLDAQDKRVLKDSLPARVQDACFGATPKAVQLARDMVGRGFDLGGPRQLDRDVASVIASHLESGSVPLHESLWPLARTNRRNYEAWSGTPV